MVNVSEAVRIEEVLLSAYPHLRVDPVTGAQGSAVTGALAAAAASAQEGSSAAVVPEATEASASASS